jgi:hypothetical protein
LKRTLASLLLVLISFPLIGPALFAGSDSDSNLPACCRRDGKHHCAMMDAADRQKSEAGPALKATKCPQFPSTTVAPGCAKTIVLSVSPAIGTVLQVQPACFQRAERIARATFSRSLQKRGPPYLA